MIRHPKEEFFKLGTFARDEVTRLVGLVAAKREHPDGDSYMLLLKGDDPGAVTLRDPVSQWFPWHRLTQVEAPNV